MTSPHHDPALDATIADAPVVDDLAPEPRPLTRAELRRQRARARRRRLIASGTGVLAIAGLAGGVLAMQPAGDANAADANLSAATVEQIAEAGAQTYTVEVASLQAAGVDAAPLRDSGLSVTTIDTSPASLKLIAAQMIQSQYGWGADQMRCLDLLWMKESGWRWNATNPDSGAYGIPQSWPAEKLATAGADWRTNPITQMQWGIDYIKAAHGTPCSAWYQHNGSY